jgi:phosphoribosyl-AMP cyclohydrolase
MSFTPDELRRLLLPALAALAMLAVGSVAIWAANTERRSARAALAVAQEERQKNTERLARIAEEEREVKEKLDIYQRLKALHVLGEERRLEWADAIARIRAQRELLDLRYRVERQRLLNTVQGKPGNVEFYASTMNVDMALLHEEDLTRFLGDLRASGNAYYSVKRCQLERRGQPAGSTQIAPRLHADCQIDLITIIDRAAKK